MMANPSEVKLSQHSDLTRYELMNMDFKNQKQR